MPVNVRPNHKAKKIKEKILGVSPNLLDPKYKRIKRPEKIDKYITQEPRGTVR